ncbi:MAG: uroporphyrinogen-III synthase [Bacillus sp. (in: Bacteria)]|nr:uroporphyrinogen-III synthase [Bacillus sp. (in: firmicutes)]
MKKLTDKRIALAGPRKAEEQSAIVKNLGGIPLLRPAQGTVFLSDANVEAEITKLLAGYFDWLIVTTGVGTETLVKKAREMGQGEAFIAALTTVKIAARGYKTVNMLKKLGLKPVVRDDDGSTSGLVRSLSTYDFKGLKVALQLHGDPAPRLVDWLQQQEAEFHEILPYKHIPPEPEVLEMLITEILSGQIDAVSFTSTPQARFLLSYAKEKGVKDEVLAAFSTTIVALSVGKVTGQALREEGIKRIVMPEDERMGSALMALAEYYHERR